MEKIDPDEFTLSLTGFDEIAIERYWNKPLNEIGGLSAARALVFIHEKRNGKADPDAYQAAMRMPMGDVQDMFEKKDREYSGDIDEALEPGKA